MPSISKTQDITIPIPDYTTPSVNPRGDAGTRVIDRLIIQDVNREIPISPDPVYRPVNISISKIPGSLLDIDPELNTDFKVNFPFQEGVISEM